MELSQMLKINIGNILINAVWVIGLITLVLFTFMAIMTGHMSSRECVFLAMLEAFVYQLYMRKRNVSGWESFTKKDTAIIFIGLSYILSMAIFAFISDGTTGDCAKIDQPTLAIGACTKIIEGKGQPKEISAALSKRGAAYSEAKQYEVAIQDLNRAIQLDQTNAPAFAIRAGVHTLLRQYVQS
jgi:tetratricopeptide (TPR) repeat protein